MCDEFEDVFRDGCCDSGVHDISEGSKTNNDLVYVSIGKVLKYSGDQHDE